MTNRIKVGTVCKTSAGKQLWVVVAIYKGEARLAQLHGSAVLNRRVRELRFVAASEAELVKSWSKRLAREALKQTAIAAYL